MDVFAQQKYAVKHEKQRRFCLEKTKEMLSLYSFWLTYWLSKS
jgi:hypothetical protein